MTEKNNKLNRMANLELLRCFAMMMVVVLHYLGKGNLLPDLTGESLGNTGVLAWLLECFCIVAVNVYMLISGYFLCTSSFKPGRLIQLYLQVWVYSVGVGMLSIITGIFPAPETHDFLTMLFPVSMGHYWFMTAYVFLYIMLPFMGAAVRRMTKGQMQIALGILLLFFCVLKSILPIRLEMDSLGYDCLWYLCVFMTAAYIRRFGSRFLKKKSCCILIYVVACLLILGVTMGLRRIYLSTGSLGRIIKIALEYNHILPYLASIGLFGWFLQVKVPERPAIIVNKIAPYTLGVYLLHENIGVRYAWQNWLGAGRVTSVAELLLFTLVAVVAVFAVGILLDMLRVKIMQGLHLLFEKIGVYKRLVEKVQCADKLFAIDTGMDKK